MNGNPLSRRTRHEDEDVKLEVDSSEGIRVLRARGATAEPCRREEHSQHGLTRLVFRIGPDNEPEPIFTRDRVVFYTCSGCNAEEYETAMPNCPAGHRPYRYHQVGARLQITVGCHACNGNAVLQQ